MATAANVDGKLRSAATKLARIFQLPVPDAPGLVFFGGEADPALLDPLLAGLPIGYLAGSGLSPQRAFESCVGEGIEYLSQFLRPGDPIDVALRDNGDRCAAAFIAAVFDVCRVDVHRPIAWVPVRRLSDGAEEWFPADLCYRRAQQDFVAPLKLSTGCAAGPTPAAATVRGLLELVERDSVALWWRGGQRGHPLAEESQAVRGANELLAQLRGDRRDRQTWLLDITTDIGIPVVAAISTGEDGHGMAYGFGARLTLTDAVVAAIFELCQVELGQHVVAAKRQEAGDAALNDNDRRILRRTTRLDARSCILLQPDGAPAPEMPTMPDEPDEAMRYIVDLLAGRGIATYLLDLTRADFGVPVVRVLAPGLQLEPCDIIGERLARTIVATGGGTVHTGGLSLL